MDQIIDVPQAINSTDKLNVNSDIINNIEEEEEVGDKQSQPQENIETKPSLLDEVTQTETTVFEKMQDNLLDKNESNNQNQNQNDIINNKDDNNQNKYDNFMEREFYPQFKVNEQKIDTQIEKIDLAIEKLRHLTNSFNQNMEKTPSTSTSASIEHLSESLKIDPVLFEKPRKTKQKAHKKFKSKRLSPVSKPITYSTNVKRKSRKKSIKKHKRFLSPLKMTTEKRMEMLSRKRSPDKNIPDNQIYIPKGSSPFDPIVLRSGYPIVFDYEPKEQIRQERIPHGPMKTLYKNGDIKYEFRDGTVRIKTNTGFTYTYYTNGDKQQEFPDGVNAYRYSSNGSVEFRCPDKTLMYFFEDGQIEEHFSNGETRVRFPDRSEIKIFVDNTFIYKDRNGIKKEGKIFNDHMKINYGNSPISGNSSGISTPTPRKKVPISASIASPDPITQNLAQDNSKT